MRIITGILMVAFLPSAALAAKCGVSDLQKCLDSACAENIEMDPAERCYQCGTAAAERPKAAEYKLGGDTPGMRSLSVGKSSKNTLSDKELKSAPKDPGERYRWATAECLKKLSDCSAEDAADNYDILIERSCKAALGESEYAASIGKAAVKKTQNQCLAELNECLLSDAKCGGDMLACEGDGEFDRNFSACAAEASGCGDFMTALRASAKGSLESMVARKESRLADLVALRQNERREKFESANRLCAAGGKDGCILEMCANLPNGLNEDGLCGDPNEKIWAANLCRFVDIACDKLK
jgi:hypothetical protein